MITKVITVYDMIHAGHVMDETRAEIMKILNESGLSLLNQIIILDLLAFNYKLRFMK